MIRTIKSLSRRAARILLRQNSVWKLSQRLPGAEGWWEVRDAVVRKSARKKCKQLLRQNEVIAGPFEGLKYAETASVGSMIWPKLLGTYESELQPCLNTIARQNYKTIIDVGYAEGFYLVGLGRWFEDAELVGFDLEPEAERQCRLNASVNGIDPSRLKLFGGFEHQRFGERLRENSLVIVDCEGFENDVVAGVSNRDTTRADWLIETHDHLVPGTTERITEQLQSTHDIALIRTDEDFTRKCQLLPMSIREQCDREEQEAIVTEGRVERQSWVFAMRRAA